MQSICKQCKKKFQHYLSEKRKFCSYKCYWEWMKNKKQARWIVDKRAKSQTGLKRRQETCKRMSEAQKENSEMYRKKWLGELNPNWKGGVRVEYKHWKDAKYKDWRLKVFTRDNWTCQNCGLRGVYLEPHHIKGWTKYPKLRYDVNNGVALCKECHLLIHRIK